jgi:RNA polymerase sigma-70 factor (ECF subfamily)
LCKLYQKLHLALEQHGNISDNELLSHYYNDGNNRWLGILLQRYTLLLYGVCMKYLKNEEEAKDAVQQVFEKAIKELGKYKVDYFKSWIYMVAKNHCLMKLRDKGKLPAELHERHTFTPAEETDKTELLQKEELMNELANALPLLNNEQKHCIELFYLQNKSYIEIAELTGYSQMQVKSHIQNGKRNLKLILLKRMSHE